MFSLFIGAAIVGGVVGLFFSPGKAKTPSSPEEGYLGFG
jgi:hypothetical protein